MRYLARAADLKHMHDHMKRYALAHEKLKFIPSFPVA